MPRQRKDSKVLNINLDMAVSNMLEEFCDETGLSKTCATERILRQYLEEYFRRSNEERKLFK